MDAVKFLVELDRMCEYEKREQIGVGCETCQFYINEISCSLESLTITELKKAVAIVEKWSNEYPQKTYKDDFLEEFPNAKCFDDGIPMVHWCDVYNKGNCKYGQGDGFRMCVECWSEPIG